MATHLIYDFCFFIIADEQEKVQKKTFTNWLNAHLKKSTREPILQVSDLFEDIKCGVILLTLLEVLSGEKLVSYDKIKNTYLHLILCS